jgi:hypothetical protein
MATEIGCKFFVHFTFSNFPGRVCSRSADPAEQASLVYRRRERQTVCKPGSVPPRRAATAIPLGRPLPDASCDRPERRREGSPGTAGLPGGACRSYLVLLPVGFSLPPPLPAARCALTAPFHPYRPSGMAPAGGGVLSVALSLGSPPPGVTRHRASVEPGLSSPRQRRAAIRPSGSLMIKEAARAMSKGGDQGRVTTPTAAANLVVTLPANSGLIKTVASPAAASTAVGQAK